jgi:xanthine dehydrogenase accessory factor
MTVDVGLLARAAELAGRGEPFVLATVVWRRGPTSGQQGAKAIVLADGRVEGWVGGACSLPTVVREARNALADGQPRLMVLGPADELDGVLREGVQVVPMACDSEGAVELYLEPVLPPPHVVIVGSTPTVDRLAALARVIGWRATVVDDGGVGAHPDDVAVVGTLDFAEVSVDSGTAIIVATQGHYDEAALEAALATPAGFVGLVASARRAVAVLDYLRARGFADEDLARVRAPVGLDLGRVEQGEIAVAILAELVALKTGGGLGSVGLAAAESAASAAAREQVDPVCGMVVDPATSRHRAEHDGHTVWFCSAGCQRQFDADPAKYA